jgi:hypothetical protein
MAMYRASVSREGCLSRWLLVLGGNNVQYYDGRRSQEEGLAWAYQAQLRKSVASLALINT